MNTLGTPHPSSAAAVPVATSPGLRLEACPVTSWGDRVAELQARDGATFVDLFAGCGDDGDGTVGLTLLMARSDTHEWLALRDRLAPDAGYPSLADVLPAAEWYERELFEGHRVVPVGHPRLHPLGHGGHHTPDDILSDGPPPRSPDGVVDYPLGPVRSGIVESGHYTLRTVGEEIVDVRLQLGWKHRGIEALATSTAWPLLRLLAERISGTDAVAHGLACCTAMEALQGLTPSPRAHTLRLIVAELERLHDHAAFQAELCQATGLAVAQAQFEIVRERLLRLAARLVGHRYLFGFVVPGGVAHDFDATAIDDLTSTVAAARRELIRLGALAAASGSHQDRLRGTGRVTFDQASSLALTGPVARAAGLDADARRDMPYGSYAAVRVPVALAEAGDAAARAMVRQAEMLASADLILDAASHLPDGPITPRAAFSADAASPLPPSSVGLGWTEGSRGLEIHWLETDWLGHLRRYRVRSASFACWQVFARVIPGGNILTDFPIIEQSFGLSFAGSDR